MRSKNLWGCVRCLCECGHIDSKGGYGWRVYALEDDALGFDRQCKKAVKELRHCVWFVCVCV